MIALAIAYQWSCVWDNRGAVLRRASELALKIAAVALVLSVVVGLLLALARMRSPPLRWIAALYINIFRGMPALVTRALGVLRRRRSSSASTSPCSQAGVISLTLLYSAFISEIYRAALRRSRAASARRASRSACSRRACSLR